MTKHAEVNEISHSFTYYMSCPHSGGYNKVLVQQERKEFISANQLDKEIALTAEEMSVFYKSFLDKNWRSHLTYNWEWYKRNALLVLLHLRVNLERLSRRRVKLAGKR